ncbi:response regulator [Aequorivita sp. F47161]|uniref:Response regulator n=1 Tax=Aequorivita vitellina TaxID=2874475 RepID=A0A9X1U2Y7_9FLAO|nr:response regulator [Aequorivita vitellina]MCG2418727.1 response regulator [Aequorivita vitellina]HNP68755.1 response regulator [Aequorivita sp.]
MNPKNLNTIIIDDHPLLIEAYRNSLMDIEAANDALNFTISEANSCDTALELLDRIQSTGQHIDLVFLDIKIPESKDGTHLSGEDIGLEIRARFPNSKIIIATTFNNNYRIHTIFKSINPDGFLIKGDISTGILLPAILDVLSDPPFYSKSVLKSLRKSVSHDFLLDKWDRMLLYELSQGIKMKELPEILPFSIAAIEKRKRHIKLLFDIEEADDRQLLLKARELGFI